jgi:hypothetical protein
MECQFGYKEEKLAFMAIGALLGVKILRRNAEHVVTLNANTMKHRLPRRRRFVFRSMSLGLSGFGCHNQTLAYRRLSRHSRCACAWPCGIPAEGSRILRGAVGIIQISAGLSFAA